MKEQLPIPGVRAVEALLEHAPERIQRIIYRGRLAGARARLLRRAKDLGIRCEEGDPNAYTKERSQGIIALARSAEYLPWSQLLELQQEGSLLLALDQVTDPQNMGAILRSAEALGAAGLLITKDRCARLGPAVTRSSAGASELLPVAMEINLARALSQAREAGFQILGADMKGQAPWSLDWRRPTVLVIGAEGQGLRRLSRAACDQLVSVPLKGRTASLNASAAAAILIYEARRALEISGARP